MYISFPPHTHCNDNAERIMSFLMPPVTEHNAADETSHFTEQKEEQQTAVGASAEEVFKGEAKMQRLKGETVERLAALLRPPISSTTLTGESL